MQVTTTTPAFQNFDLELDQAVAGFLADDRWPIVHVALGFKSVIKAVTRGRKLRVIFLAIDLDARVHAIVDSIVRIAASVHIPIVFALLKKDLGSAMGLTGTLGCVALYEEAPLSPRRQSMLSRVFVLAARERVEHLKYLAHLAVMDVLRTYATANSDLVSPVPRRVHHSGADELLARMNSN